MKIRILSDLHLDVNHYHMFKLDDNNVFTILAGDTAGDPAITTKWIEKNVKNGLFISGNHLVYNNRKMGIQQLREELAKNFPIDANVSYLDVETGAFAKEVDGILFIGTTLYTDFKYKIPANPGGDQAMNMDWSLRIMNDYRWGRVYLENLDSFRILRPDDYLAWFNNAMEKITKVLDENAVGKKLPVVMITHHCPLMNFVDFKYINDLSTASYVSDLSDFIEKYKEIKAWICGHVHSYHRFDYTRNDKSVVKMISNPRGYVYGGESLDFNANTFLDTDTWEFEITPLSKHQIEKRKRQRDKAELMQAFLI